MRLFSPQAMWGVVVPVDSGGPHYKDPPPIRKRQVNLKKFVQVRDLKCTIDSLKFAGTAHPSRGLSVLEKPQGEQTHNTHLSTTTTEIGRPRKKEKPNDAGGAPPPFLRRTNAQCACVTCCPVMVMAMATRYPRVLNMLMIYRL